MPSVYIETTIVSYLTAWPSRDVVRLAHEMLTRQWWAKARFQCNLYTSELVRREASAGDPAAAANRLNALLGIPLLDIIPEITTLAADLAMSLELPERARADAIHLAIAAVHEIEFLLTWNCKHLANAALAGKIDMACERSGYPGPRVVTPEQLMELP